MDHKTMVLLEKSSVERIASSLDDKEVRFCLWLKLQEFEMWIFLYTTRKHSSRIRTARSLRYGGSPWQRPALDRDPPWTETPLDRDPRTETPLLDRDSPDRDPVTLDRDPTPLDRDPRTETPSLTETSLGQRPCLDRDSPWTETLPRGQTNTYENVTFANFVCGL